jgi:tetratricopeptide (TPR) repeat protein
MMAIRRLFAHILLVMTVAGCAAPAGGGDTKDATTIDAVADLKAGVGAQQRGDDGEAIRLLTRAIDAGTLSDYAQSAAYYDRSLSHQKKGQYERAIADSDAAIRIRPDSVEAYLTRGVTHTRTGQFDLAIADFDAAIRLKPDDVSAYNDRGAAYARKGNHDRAIVDYEEAIRRKPDAPEYYYNRGLAYYNLGQIDRAIADDDNAIRLKPDYAIAYVDRGLYYAVKGQHDQAMSDFTVGIKLSPNLSRAYFNRGLTELALGRHGDAAADFVRDLALEPTNTFFVLWLHLARAKAGVEDREEFAGYVAKTDRTKWPDPIVALYLGRITADQLRMATVYTDAAIQRDRDCLASFHSSEYHQLRKEANEAKLALQHAAEICPSIGMVRLLASDELRRLSQ